MDARDRECGHCYKGEVSQKDDAINVYDDMLQVAVTLTRSVVGMRTPQ